MLAVTDRWPLFRGGCQHRFDCISYLMIRNILILFSGHSTSLGAITVGDEDILEESSRDSSTLQTSDLSNSQAEEHPGECLFPNLVQLKLAKPNLT